MWCSLTRRSVFIVFTLQQLTLTTRISAQFSQNMFNVKFRQNKVLYGHSFLNITDTNMAGCMGKCLENCLCQSFQLCDEKECQLCSSKQDLSPSALRERQGCVYYEFEEDSSEQCNPTCFSGIPCCMTSNPCHNGGTCGPAASAENHVTARFACTCPRGFAGNLCHHPITTSCRGHANGSRIPGKYHVFDANMKPYEVFCDFDSNSSMAWTLIQSYQLRTIYKFSKYFLRRDRPVNEDTPIWDAYRLSRSRMDSIQQNSSKWRITCQYNTDGINYTDYIQANNSEINIMDKKFRGCKEVEYVNIRGYSCRYCTAMISQGYHLPFHVETGQSKYCGFEPKGILDCSNDTSEQSFGLYLCANPAHRCSATPTSTTQTWFGG